MAVVVELGVGVRLATGGQSQPPGVVALDAAAANLEPLKFLDGAPPTVGVLLPLRPLLYNRAR